MSKFLKISVVLSIFLISFDFNGEAHPELPNACELLLSIKNPVKKAIYFSEINSVSDDEIPIMSVTLDKPIALVKIPCRVAHLIKALWDDKTFEIYIKPGENVSFSFDTNDLLKSILFIGANSIENNYLVLKDSYQRSNLPEFDKFYALDSLKFDSINDHALRYCHQLANEKLRNIPVFNTQMHLDLLSAWLINKLQYPGYHNYFSSRKVDTRPDFSLFDKLISTHSDLGMLSNNYIVLITMYLDYSVRSNPSPSPPKSIKAQQKSDLITEQKMINEKIKNQRLKSLFIGRLMWKYIDLGFKDEYLQHFKKEIASTTNRFFKPSKIRYNALKTIDSGKVAPNFTYQDTSGVTHKLSELKGKYIYINVWSLGCHASLEENEKLIDLQGQFKNKTDLIFLNLNLDNTKKNIVEYLQTRGLSGINASCKSDHSKFPDEYFISYTPRFILIDSLGRIIQPFAARPSSPEFTNQLNALFDKN